MRTPREILLARHRAAEPKLDAIRRSAVAETFGPDASGKPCSGMVAWLLRCSTIPWRELVLPSRRLWAGLAAVWVVLAIIHLSQRDTVSSITGQPVHSPAMMMSWQVQQRLMNEVLVDRVTPPDAERPRNAVPRPRTEEYRSAHG